MVVLDGDPMTTPKYPEGSEWIALVFPILAGCYAVYFAVRYVISWLVDTGVIFIAVAILALCIIGGSCVYVYLRWPRVSVVLGGILVILVAITSTGLVGWKMRSGLPENGYQVITLVVESFGTISLFVTGILALQRAWLPPNQRLQSTGDARE